MSTVNPFARSEAIFESLSTRFTYPLPVDSLPKDDSEAQDVVQDVLTYFDTIKFAEHPRLYGLPAAGICVEGYNNPAINFSIKYGSVYNLFGRDALAGVVVEDSSTCGCAKMLAVFSGSEPILQYNDSADLLLDLGEDELVPWPRKTWLGGSSGEPLTINCPVRVSQDPSGFFEMVNKVGPEGPCVQILRPEDVFEGYYEALVHEFTYDGVTQEFEAVVAIRNFSEDHVYFGTVSGSFAAECLPLTVTSVAGGTIGTTALSVDPTLTDGHSYVYKTAAYVDTPAYVSDLSDWTAWDGISDVLATTGDALVVAEIDADGLARKAGSATVTSASE